MKRILSLALAMLMIIVALLTLVSCADSIQNKTVKEVYDAAVKTVETMEKFDISMSSIYTSFYNGEEMSTSEALVTYKSNGTSYYYDEKASDGAVNKFWYANNELYSLTANFKEKNTITKEAFEDRYMVPKDSLIFKIYEASFNGVEFVKMDGGIYVANVAITPENYYNYTQGVQISGNADCKMTFDKNGNILSFGIAAMYDRGDGITLQLDREIKFNSIGKDVDVALPENASEFRVAPTMESLNMNTLSSIGNLVETTEKTDLVKMTVANYGDVVIRLYPNVAPATVENFKNLVSQNFYDGLTFHRIIENMLIQGGDPKGNGTGGSDKNIVGEFEYNGFTNNLLHKRGVVSMARSELYDSASSQFFIVHTDNLYWDRQYATFGYVVYGMDVVDKITAVETDESDKPLNEVKITSIRFVKEA